MIRSQLQCRIMRLQNQDHASSSQPVYYYQPSYEPPGHGPPPDPGYQGAAGGIVGAVARVKQRKERAAWLEAEGKKTPHTRPGHHADGTSDGTLGIKEIQMRLAIATDGMPPPEKEVLKLLMSPTVKTNGKGRVAEDQMDTIIALYASREEREPGQSSSKWAIDKKTQQSQGCGCTIQ